MGYESSSSTAFRAAGYVRIVANHAGAHVANKRLDNTQWNPQFHHVGDKRMP